MMYFCVEYTGLVVFTISRDFNTFKKDNDLIERSQLVYTSRFNQGWVGAISWLLNIQFQARDVDMNIINISKLHMSED